MLPTAYLTSTKNLESILTAIQQAQAPKQFSIRFLENLGFKSNADRLVIGVLKGIGFLDAGGQPTQRYFRYLDQTQSGRVLAEGVREAYSDLFQLNKQAHELSRADIKGKLKTLTQGQYGESVLDKMVSTFLALSKNADFAAADESGPSEAAPIDTGAQEGGGGSTNGTSGELPETSLIPRLGGLVYNIQIQLPESRDPAVYDALFRSLRVHLLE